MLTLSDVQVGKPSTPFEWSNRLQKHVEVDYKEQFVSDIKKANHERNFRKEETWDQYDLRLKKIGVSDDTLIPNASHYHANYLTYLEKCWADHLGIVITPDIIWYTLLCEFSSIVKSDPESYRSLFTDSPGKKEIVVASGSLTTMPLDLLTEGLKDAVPSDTSIFFPKFPAFTHNSANAFLAAFCDICSPYYNYSMMLCGFPYIDVRGSIEDWKTLREQWDRLKKIMKDNKWIQTVDGILTGIIVDFSNVEFWKNMFRVEHCGSGHQTLLSGWFTDLFRKQPRVRYAENFSSHVSNIKYKQLDTKREYEMSVGLFNSILMGDCMEPEFSFIVYDVTGV